MIPRKLSFRKDAASELQKLWCLGILPFLPPPLSVFSQSGFNSGPSFPTTYTGLAHSFLFASSHLCFSLQLFPSGTFCHSLGLDSYPSLSITVSLPASPFLYLSLRRPSGTLLQSITIEAHRAPILPVLLPSLARFGPGSAHSGRESVLETAHTDIICCPGAPSYSWAAQSHFGPVGGPALTPELLKDFGASATWKEGGPCRLQGLLGQDGLDWGTWREIDISTQHLLLDTDGGLNHHCTFANKEIVGGLKELMGLTKETFAITHPTQSHLDLCY